MQFNESFEQAGARTAQFMRDLKELDLLMDGETTIQADGIEQPFIYRGFRIVNEQKLSELRGDQLRKIHKNGMLPLLYAHLFSLSLMRDIFSRQMQLRPDSAATAGSLTRPARRAPYGTRRAASPALRVVCSFAGFELLPSC